MLKLAHLYQDQIIRKMQETWYNEEYKYYYDQEPMIPDFPQRPDGFRQFASVDSDGNVIGYLSYRYNSSTSRCYNFGIISFDKGNYEFVKDVIQMINDIFIKFGMNSMEFMCFARNTAVLRSYRNFIKNYGGKEVGTLRDCTKSFDNKLCDVVLFEVHRNDLNYMKDNNGGCYIVSKARFLKHYLSLGGR